MMAKAELASVGIGTFVPRVPSRVMLWAIAIAGFASSAIAAKLIDHRDRHFE